MKTRRAESPEGVSADKLLGRLPAPWPEDLLSQIQSSVKAGGCKVVVLDDDPTGTQTVHGVPVLTEWSQQSLQAELQSDLPAFYILTNSRSLPPDQARQINAEIGRNLRGAADAAGKPVAVVSRSDSTLRGHFPAEMEALDEALGQFFDGWILCPFFQEGGRYTIGNVHYVREADRLVPAGQTEFARDPAFGYRSSNLSRWVEEKTAGIIRAGDTITVSLEDIRRGGPRRVEEILLAVSDRRVCVIDAAEYRDLEVFVLGLLAAEAKGKAFLYRTAASFVRVRAGIPTAALLTASQLGLTGKQGGLILVGSHVPRTTQQLDVLLQARPAVIREEVNVRLLLDRSARDPECKRVAAVIDEALRSGKDAVAYTSRKQLAAADAAASLDAARMISQGLVSILRQIRTRPRYLLAKGGITASDAATAGLNLKRAMVAGQIIAGVPVWQTGGESRHPAMPLIVFPGNVGNEKSLLEVVEKLHGR